MRPEEKLARILIARKKTIAIAESCSGGLLSHTLTNIPGSSSFFHLGIIAYDNAAKVKLLKVPPTMIKKHGAVSSAVAQAMADAVRGILKSDYGIAITGIAGPGGFTKTKPLGLTFIAVSTPAKTIVLRYVFEGNRLDNKKSAAQAALRILEGILA